MSNVFNLPRYIALCGNPKSGKSLVQEILLNNYGVQPVDDGRILRDVAMRHFGAKASDVETQDGKAALAYWPDGSPLIDNRTTEHLTWRRFLGILGEQLEAMIGEFVMPLTAVAPLSGPGPFSFGSVRKTQGHFFKNNGGLVIGIRNPQAPETGNAFDKFDAAAVHVWIENDALARGLPPYEARKDLEAKLHQVVIDWSWCEANAKVA